MSKIQLMSDYPHNHISVPRVFIDQYMTDANGEFVKVYLYLLRCMGASCAECSISAIADHFNNTEKDILRALKYWEKVGVLSLELNSKNQITCLRFKDLTGGLQTDVAIVSSTPSVTASPSSANTTTASSVETTEPVTNESASMIETFSNTSTSMQTSKSVSSNAKKAHSTTAKREYTKDEVKAFTNNHEISELLFIIETYLKHPLTPTEMNTLFFWYDELKFPGELIEYLVEYCITNGHSSLRYMDKVAFGWAENGIDTVEKAKEQAALRSKAYYSIMKAFGISGRSLADSEMMFVNKWSKEYGFDIELIQEACKRTIAATQKPSFEYADSILTNWYKNHVHNAKDVAALDEAFNKNKRTTSKAPTITTTKRNSFHNFNQRSYDSDELKKMLLTTSIQ